MIHVSAGGLREMGEGRSLMSHWIIESADYLQPIKMLIFVFSAHKVGGLLH